MRLRLAALSLALTAASPGDGRVVFVDIADQAGITFVHDMGKTGQKMMVETMGSGGGFIDYDSDGDPDIYLVNGAPLPGSESSAPSTNALYRNDGQGRFVEVTGATGTADRGYGMGLCVADYDNDGYPDLYVTNYGPNVLYRNRGDGTFEEATSAAGVAGEHWSSSCAFIDYDRDGDADLYVVNYVDFSPDDNKFCGDFPGGVRAYCHPSVYEAEPDILYRNEGDGTFADVSEVAGLTARWGNGLGVTPGDFDDDGDTDLYVANDKSPNVLYRNDGDRFVDITLRAGVGFSLDGEPQAGMGTDFGDYDGDGDLDIVVTNLDFENNSLYRNEGGGIFSDASFASGIGAPSLSYVGFGADFFDYDNDGRQDLAVANGHILDNAPYFNDATTYAQHNFLFQGKGNGTMIDRSESTGESMRVANVARGLSTGDIDDDGDLDMLVTLCGGRPRLLRNDGGNARHWLGVRLIGRASNRSALGARVVLDGPHGVQIGEVRSGSSYQSQADLRLHFGLGDRAGFAPDLRIVWPSGLVQTATPDRVDRHIVIVEGEGIR